MFALPGRRSVGMAVQIRLRQLVHDALAEPLAESIQAASLSLRHLAASKFAGDAEADDRMAPAACRTACRVRGRRRRSAVRAGRAGPSCGRTARRCPSDRTSCGPDRLSRSIPISSTSTGTLPTACTASVWNRTPFSLHSLPIALIGCKRADLVVRRHDRNEDRLVRHRLANLVGVTPGHTCPPAGT